MLIMLIMWDVRLTFIPKSMTDFLLVGDFNAEEKEFTMENFMDLYNLNILVKDNTCFKSVENPSCVDLFLTNCCRSFQNTTVISIGISDDTNSFKNDV